MSDHSTHQTPVDPRDLDRAGSMWEGFTRLMTFGAIAVCGVLCLMALFLV
jgi:hypothetical protein